jgi:hypothetical protein
MSALKASETPRIGSGGAIAIPSKRDTFTATVIDIRPNDCKSETANPHLKTKTYQARIHPSMHVKFKSNHIKIFKRQEACTGKKTHDFNKYVIKQQSLHLLHF